MSSASWHLGAVGYEVYIRSFADTDGDGIGDLDGVRAHLDHLEWLGVDAVWVTPFYPSPGHDHGYDVSDYTSVNPIHGTLDDFDQLVAEAHARGLKVLIDIVPNHTSSEHPWFQEAVRNPTSPYRNYYLWRDPAPDGSPPNNWRSHFGGPAWTMDPMSGQYYCHLFLSEQPDLNWDNPAVHQEFETILRFWCERGVDGFRVDVAYGVSKDPEFRDNPQIRPITDDMDPNDAFESFDHLYDIEQERNLDVFRRWRQIVDEYEAIIVAEVRSDEPDRAARYSAADDAFHLVFFLWPGWTAWEPDALVRRLAAMERAAPNAVGWVIDNHDQSRSVSRYGEGETGRHRSLAMMTLLAGLGGTPFIYQGQELGLPDGRIARTDAADPIALRNPGAEGRDGSRTAMPWDTSDWNGFSTHEPWLPALPRPEPDTVAAQRDNPRSMLWRHRRLLEARRSHPDLWTAPAEWIRDDESIALVRRGDALVAANLSPGDVELDLPTGTWEIAFVTRLEDAATVRGNTLTLPAETTCLLTRAREGERR